MTPTTRTLQKLKADGIPAQTVERFCHFSKRRIDLFGVIDVLAILPHKIVGIQVTSGDNVAARITKINHEPRALAWVKAGGGLEVHGWRKGGARGKRKTWTCRVAFAGALPDGERLLWTEIGANNG